MGHQLISMKKQLILYILKLLLGTILLGAGWLILTYILIGMNIVLPANYSEVILQENKGRLLEIDEITADDLPKGSKFLVISYENDEKYGNMNDEEIEHAINIIAGSENALQGHSVYYVISRCKDTCVVKYNMKACINLRNSRLQTVDYDSLSCVCMILIYILFAYCITLKLTKIWKNEFKKIEEMTLEIEKSNLDFEYRGSKIKEFNHVIESIISMRDALKETIYLNWRIENEKIEQIGALAHDIKIPLTVIKGNTELLLEHNCDTYNNSHLTRALDAAQELESYTSLLIQYVHDEKKEEWVKKIIYANSFSELLHQKIENYIVNANVPFEIIGNEVEGKLYIDYFAIERVVLNIIDNAIQYKVADDKIICCLGKEEGNYICSISNKFGNFSEEVLLKATELFYTSSKSRNSLHYGIGLAHAKKTVEAHNGKLSLYNSKEDGATVKILLPLIID